MLKEIYYDSALSPDSGFSPSDVKHVFSNLLAIVNFEATFVDLLSNAIQGDDGLTQGTIGLVFKDMVRRKTKKKRGGYIQFEIHHCYNCFF